MEENFDKDDLLGRWLGGSLSEAEERALKARADFAEYERLANAVKKLPRPTYDAQGALAQLKARRKQASNRGAAAGARKGNGAKVSRLRPAYWLGIAAAVLLVVTAVFLLQPRAGLELTAAAGTMEQVELPDGSSVQLNAASSLTFTGSEAARVAEMDGEAYFEIERDGRPFTISTSRGKVRVLGTSFNVYSRDGAMRVSCTTGKVSVRFQDVNSDEAEDKANTYILTPGKSVSIDVDGTVSKADIPASESLDWLNGKSVFNERPLSEVIAELERQYDLDIKLSPNQDLEQIIKTTFPHDSLDLALEIALCPLENLKYQRNGKTVVLTPK
jgi:ferric-dicitrate binding protein FerR (iron transport regulator)